MLDVIDRLSWPGSPDHTYEDAFGAARYWAWMIDAPVFPATVSIMRLSSEAA